MTGALLGPAHTARGVDEIQDEKRPHSIVGEALPELGEEEHREPWRLRQPYRETPASTSECSRARTAGTPSKRKRARVGPGPTRTVIASGGSASNRSSSVRSSPMPSTVVEASRSGGSGGTILPL